MGNLVHALAEKSYIGYDVVMCNGFIDICVKYVRKEEECDRFGHTPQ
jgi:hypothetical protein